MNFLNVCSFRLCSTSESSEASEFEDFESSVSSVESDVAPKKRVLSVIFEYSEEDSFEQR